MVSLYEVLTDKYGDYYVSYGKKHRIKTLEKKNKKIQEDIDKLFTLSFYDSIAYCYMQRLKDRLINYKMVYVGGKKYIQFGN